MLQKLTAALLLVLLSGGWLMATDKDSSRIKPTAILFKINRSENKIQGLKERNRLEDVKIVEAYDETIAQAIMQNFQSSFTFCKVYFFNSSDLQKVIDQQWKSVSFFENDFTHTVTPPDSLLEHIFIAENNYPPQPSYNLVNPEKGTASYTSERTFMGGDETGIVTYNQHYNVLDSKLCYSPASIKRSRIKGSFPKQYHYQYNGASGYQKKLSKYFYQKTESKQ